MKILLYIEPHPIRNSKTHFDGIAREFLPLLAANRPDFDVRMFASEATFSVLGDEAKPHAARLLHATSDEEAMFGRYMQPWDTEGIPVWLDLMSGTGTVTDGYLALLRRLWRRFPFDVIVHWGENGAITRFVEETPVTRIAMELGCTRPPFMNSVVMDPHGTNGSAIVPKLTVAELRDIVGEVPMSSAEALFAYSQTLEALSYEEQFRPLPGDLAERLSKADRVAFLPLQLYDDANLLRFSPYLTVEDVVLDAVPKLVEHGYTVLIKPHPASRHRPGGNLANAIARRSLQPWQDRLIWCADQGLSYDNARLMEVSDLVVTVNSSVGFEALYFDKPVVVLGDAVYKPKDLFPSLEQYLSGKFDASAYQEGIGYLRRFFLGGYLQPEAIRHDASAFEQRVGLVHRLHQRHTQDPAEMARAFWQTVSPAIQCYAEMAAFAGRSEPGQGEFGLPLVRRGNAKDELAVTWRSITRRLLAVSGCKDEASFTKWLRTRLADPKHGVAELVISGKCVDPEEYLALHPGVKAAGVDPIRHFITHGFSEGRAPRLGVRGLRLAEAEAHLIRAAQMILTAGPALQNHPLSNVEEERRKAAHKHLASALAEQKNLIAVVAHLYYRDLVPGILDSLKTIEEPFDLIVTLPSWGTEEIRQMVQATYPQAHFCSATDRGRDTGSFLDLLPILLEKQYDAVLKIHTKRGYYGADGRLIREFGTIWREESLTALMGSAARVREIVEAFRSNPTLAMVGARPYFMNTESDIYPDDGALSELFLNTRDPSGFFAGAMFWVQPRCLIPLIRPDKLTLACFPPDSSTDDGTLAHQLEHLFGQAAARTGFEVLGAPLDPVLPLDRALHPATQSLHDHLEAARTARSARVQTRPEGALAW